MKQALTRIIETPDLSPNTYEIVSKSLGISEKKERVKAADFFKSPGVKKYANGLKSQKTSRTSNILAAVKQSAGRS